MKYVLALFLTWYVTFVCHAEATPIWVYLESGERFETLPDHLSSKLYYSPWLHAIGMAQDEKMINDISSYVDIKEVTNQNIFTYQLAAQGDVSLYGFGLEQIGVAPLIDRGLNGEGVSIGVIDGGFLSADEIEPLASLFDEDRVKLYRDYITPNMAPYGGSKALDDRHGTDVLQLIAGMSNETGVQHGLAIASQYFLARTDHGATETKVEEMYLVQALEWLDSLEVKLVNISLGYTEGFEDPKNDYSPSDLNGTSALSKAVQKASDAGMLIIVAAGNDGNKNWRTLSIPSDARGVLTVGSTKYKHWDKMAFSSIGPDDLPYLKPEISCFASHGTSFSTPVITGLAALIWQAQPDLTNTEVKSIIMRSGHLFPFGNNYVGY
ncbi:MAG: S8 family serine peptidase, partial [Bacteroidota bacterium]